MNISANVANDWIIFFSAGIKVKQTPQKSLNKDIRVVENHSKFIGLVLFFLIKIINEGHGQLLEWGFIQ